MDQYFKNSSGDFVDSTGTVVNDPATRLQISQSIGGDLNKLSAYTPSNTITPESLNSASVAPFSQPNPTTIPDVANLYSTPPLTATPEETQAQGAIDQITKLNEELVGKGAYTAEQNKNFGVDTAQKTITDLNSKLIGLQNDQAAIPLLLEKNPSSQGVASPLIDRQRSSLLRDNAIQSLTVSALMAAAQGQLSNAQSMADKAVAAKYDPIQEEITAKTNNLNLIINSPNYTLSQQNRAKQQLEIQNANQAKLDQQKQDTQAIHTIALNAAAAGADSATLDKITKAATPVAAAQAAAEFGKQQTNLQLAQTANVKTNTVNNNGVFFDAATGKVDPTPEAFFKRVGVSSFAEAYQKGFVTDINASTQAEQDFAKQAQAHYYDVFIPPNATADQVRQIVKSSRIYQKETYIAPTAGSSGGGGYTPGANPQVDAYITQIKNGNATLTNVPAAIRGQVALGLSAGTSTPIVDPTTDAQVKAIIAANPGEYGNAANAIDKAFGAGTATKYDSQLKAVYNDKQPVASAFNTDATYSPLAGSRFALEATRITKPLTDLPAYQLVAGGVPYVSRILAASNNPGSVSDQELLDAFTKLSTSGNAITDAQIKTVTGGKSFADTINTFQNKFKNGGLLSDNQRRQIIDIAQKTLEAYKKDYQPIYDKAVSQLNSAGVPQAFWTIPDLNTLANQGSQNSSSNSNVIPKGTDGAAYGFPGYVSDGTQWVQK